MIFAYEHKCSSKIVGIEKLSFINSLHLFLVVLRGGLFSEKTIVDLICCVVHTDFFIFGSNVKNTLHHMSHLGCRQSQVIQSLSDCHSGHGTDLEFRHDLKV